MTKQDKQKFRQIVNEGIEQLVLPQFDKIYKEMTTKKELRTVEKGLKQEIQELKEENDNAHERIEHRLQIETALQV